MKKITVLLMSILLLLSACGQAPIAAETETIPQVTQEQKEAPMIPAKAEAVDESTEAGDNANAAKPAEQMDAPKGADKAVEKQPASAEAGRPAVSEAPAASKSEAKSDPAPTLTSAPKPEPAPTPAPTPEPDPAPTAASGNIYSVAEAVRAGNEYAQAQYGVTIDTTMTTADSSYFPGTADSVAWLAANGGQEALNRAARGNVEATFDYLAAMDGADTVSAYARFNCTVRYNAASDEYIVVVLYG